MSRESPRIPGIPPRALDEHDRTQHDTTEPPCIPRPPDPQLSRGSPRIPSIPPRPLDGQSSGRGSLEAKQFCVFFYDARGSGPAPPPGPLRRPRGRGRRGSPPRSLGARRAPGAPRGPKRTRKKSHINVLTTILELGVLFLALCGPPGPQLDTKEFIFCFFGPPIDLPPFFFGSDERGGW